MRRARERRGRSWTAGLRAGASAPLTALRGVAREPRLVRVELAWAALMIAYWVATVSLSVVAFDEGGSAAVAVALLARTAVGAVAAPLLGVLIDRVRPQRCLVWGAGLGAVASAGAALAGSALVAVVVLVTLVALVCTLFRAAQSAVVPELVDDPAELTSVNVLSSSVESLGVFVGPALAGLLLVVQGPELAFAAAAVLLAVATLLVLGLQGAAATTEDGAAASRGRTRDLLRIRAARLMLLLLVAQTAVSGGLVVLYPALAVDALQVDLSAVGLLTSAYGLGGVVGSIGLFALAGSRRLGLCTAVALLLWALPLLVVPVAPELTPVLLLLVLVGGGNVLFDVTSVTLLQRGVPAVLLGRAFGAVELAAVIGMGLGAVAASVLDDLIGAGPAVATLAAPLALVALVSVRPLRRLDRELAAPTRQVALLRSLAPFALLPPLEIERLALHLQRVEVATGAAVVRQGETGSTWFVVEHGRLEAAVDGRAVRQMEPGDSFGEVALLRDGVRTATITALTPAVLWALDGAVFLAALRADDGRALAAVDGLARARLAHAAPGRQE
jgi:MFS family permease